jgi:EAL domain-containing protein (putative c-di-GMP-specific phosphodiesterase class I)/GGDEF domain-containing protein
MVMDQIELQHAFGRIDPVSGLPNRNQFLEDLADLGRDSPGQRRLAVLVDLARSEQLSSGLRVMGAGYLDDIVRTAAAKLKTVLGPKRTAYHVAATQFAFLAEAGVDEALYPLQLEETLSSVARQTAARFVMTSVVGVAPLVAGETNPDSILRTAHCAAQDARAAARSVGVYSAEIDTAHRRRFRLLSDFPEALESHAQLSLAFQPRIDLRSNACLAAEALLRWDHPDLGPVSPAEFIPIIEQTSLAGAVTDWVLDAALHQLRIWRSQGVELELAINISAANLDEPGFAAKVQLYLLKHAIRPEWLELEVTESAMMQDVERALAQIEALVEAGIRIAIDDFGTGYSSLSYLQRLPARVLKIDRSFVSGMGERPREEALVASMLSLAHDLGYRVVAEGIETPEAMATLRAMGCDEGQGYFIARPMSAADFENWYDADHSQSVAKAA